MPGTTNEPKKSLEPHIVTTGLFALNEHKAHKRKKWIFVAVTIAIVLAALGKTIHELDQTQPFSFKAGPKNIFSTILTIVNYIFIPIFTFASCYFHFIEYRPNIVELLDKAIEHHGKFDGTSYENNQKSHDQAKDFVNKILDLAKKHNDDHTAQFLQLYHHPALTQETSAPTQETSALTQEQLKELLIQNANGIVERIAALVQQQPAETLLGNPRDNLTGTDYVSSKTAQNSEVTPPLL